jgi:hypothetical protein
LNIAGWYVLWLKVAPDCTPFALADSLVVTTRSVNVPVVESTVFPTLVVLINAALNVPPNSYSLLFVWLTYGNQRFWY